MSRHDPLVRLRHMLDYSKEAVEMARGTAVPESFLEEPTAEEILHVCPLTESGAFRS